MRVLCEAACQACHYGIREVLSFNHDISSLFGKRRRTSGTTSRCQRDGLAILAQDPCHEAKRPSQVRSGKVCQSHVRNIRAGQSVGVNGQSSKATGSDSVLDYTFRHRRLKRGCAPFMP